MQCDFDTIGTTTRRRRHRNVARHPRPAARHSASNDFTIRVNNRAVLNGLLGEARPRRDVRAVLRALDKLAKIGREKVVEEMIEPPARRPSRLSTCCSWPSSPAPTTRSSQQLEPLVAGNATRRRRRRALRRICRGRHGGRRAGRRDCKLDLSIARGLDYYTGTIFETFLDDLPGDRQRLLAAAATTTSPSLYTKQQLPGIGASLGLDRLLAAMEELGMLAESRTPAPVLHPVLRRRAISTTI